MVVTDADPAPNRSGQPRRRYESPLRARRAEETRDSLVRVATELFTSRGWSGTGMREVAREAGVALETLYSHYASKRKLFEAVVDRAAVGDAEPVAVAQRSSFLAMGRGRRPDRIAAAAAVVAQINERTAPFARLLREAAASDAELAEILQETRARQFSDVRAGVALILKRTPTEEEARGVWAIVSPEVYLLLVVETGWSLERYEQWLSATLARVLPRA